MTWWGFSSFKNAIATIGPYHFYSPILALFALWFMTLLIVVSMLWLQKRASYDNESVRSFVMIFVFVWSILWLCLCGWFSPYPSGLLHWHWDNSNIFPEAHLAYKNPEGCGSSYIDILRIDDITTMKQNMPQRVHAYCAMYFASVISIDFGIHDL